MTLQIMTKSQIGQTINRLAYEVVERNRGAENVTVLGILHAGAEIARIVAEQIGSIESISVPVHDLDISPFRDDITGNTQRGVHEQDEHAIERPVIPDVTDRDVLLVDDVLFTGRTIRAALDAVIRFGRPRSIQLMVLIDRGHREYPIQPDYVGRTIVTKKTGRVVVTADGDDPSVRVEE